MSLKLKIPLTLLAIIALVMILITVVVSYYQTLQYNNLHQETGNLVRGIVNSFLIQVLKEREDALPDRQLATQISQLEGLEDWVLLKPGVEDETGKPTFSLGAWSLNESPPDAFDNRAGALYELHPLCERALLQNSEQTLGQYIAVPLLWTEGKPTRLCLAKLKAGPSPAAFAKTFERKLLEGILTRPANSDLYEILKTHLNNLGSIEEWILLEPEGFTADNQRRYIVLAWCDELTPKYLDSTVDTFFPQRQLADQSLDADRLKIQGDIIAAPIWDPGGAGTQNRKVLLAKLTPFSRSAQIHSDVYRTLIWEMTVGTMVIIAVLYLLLNRFVLRPISRLTGASERIALGDYTKPIPPTPKGDEFSRLIESFNTMQKKIRAFQGRMETKVIQTQDRLEKSQRDLMLAQRMTAIGNLSAGIAHEINNPLGGMINAATSLKRKYENEPKTLEYLNLVLDGLGRIQSIVQRILILTPRPQQKHSFPVEQAVQQAWKLVEFKAQQNNVTLEQKYKWKTPLLHADPREVEQVFLNLFANSLDALEEKGGQILVEGEDAGGLLVIRVKDNGPGIPDESLQNIFDMFYTTKAPGKGTGLGLSIVYNIMNHYKGSVSVESAPGQGTTVTLKFPIPEALS